jgi:hypothetical protein
MTNAIAAFSKTALSLDAVRAQVTKAAENLPDVNVGGKPYLKLSQEGEGWFYGADDIPVEPDWLWAVNPMEFKKGWVAWADPKMNGNKREKLGEVMGPLSAPPAQPVTDFASRGGSWSEQIGLELACLTGTEQGTTCLFTANSYGGKQAFAVLYTEFAKRAQDPSAGEFLIPVIRLGEDSYRNKAYGKKVYNPVFEIVDWASMSDGTMLNDSEEETTSADEVVTAEVVQEDDEPRRRRRQRLGS